MDVPNRYIGARRGVFGLQSWAPAREPGQPSSAVTVNLGNQQQTANVQRSPVVSSQSPPVQQQRHEAQSVPWFSTPTEHVANSSGVASKENSSTVKPRELSVCLTCHLLLSII